MSKILTVYNWGGSKLKKSFDGSDVILTTLVKFRLLKKMEYYCNISVGTINGTAKNTGRPRLLRFENVP